jgi:hypothetical protein
MINNRGWTCPNCGRVWSPMVAQCANCNANIASREIPDLSDGPGLPDPNMAPTCYACASAGLKGCHCE